MRRVKASEPAVPPGPKSDGLGNDIDPDGDYYVQDSRQFVGNCISWWRSKGAGYACDLEDSGIYKGSHVIGLRVSDIPWPVEYVRAHTIVHVRGDVQAFDRSNYKPGPRT